MHMVASQQPALPLVPVLFVVKAARRTLNLTGLIAFGGKSATSKAHLAHCNWGQVSNRQSPFCCLARTFVHTVESQQPAMPLLPMLIFDSREGHCSLHLARAATFEPAVSVRGNLARPAPRVPSALACTHP